MVVSNLRIDAGGGVGIHLKGESPNVVTKSLFENIQIINSSTGIFLDPTSTEVYKNAFRDIQISKTSEYGIRNGVYPAGGPYNLFDNIEIVNTSGYAISNSGNECYFVHISTDGVILDVGQNNVYKNITIETIYSSAPPSKAVVNLQGYNTTVIKLTLTNIDPSKTPYGVFMYAEKEYTLIDVKTMGTTYPNYAIYLNGSAPIATVINANLNSNYTVIGDTSKSKFINSRINGKYLNNENITNFTGDGTTTTFSVAHGLITTPSKYFMQPLNDLAKNYSTFSADTTYLYVKFSSAPPSGSTLSYYWYAEV